MYNLWLINSEYAYYEARYQYRDSWATGGYPHIIVACPNGILYRVYIDKELNPFYEQVSPEMHIFRTAFGDQYEYILSQYGLPEALFSLSQSEREIQSPETKEIKKFFQENEKNSKQSF